MPIFEFYCQSCSAEFEELVFADKKPICPKCKSEKTDKMISRPCRNRASGGGDSVESGATSSCGGCSANSCAGCGSR